VATSAENPEKISANEGSMEALIKRRRQLLEELAALRSCLRYHLGRKRPKRKAGGNSGSKRISEGT
jgi:quinol monooxygenase YgiN